MLVRRRIAAAPLLSPTSCGRNLFILHRPPRLLAATTNHHRIISTRLLCTGPPKPKAAAAATASSPAPPNPEAKGEFATGIDAVRRAWTFLWDPAEPDLRLRIGGAFCLMIGAKLTAIQVPFLFKFAIDALSEPATAAAAGSSVPLTSFLALTPAGLLLAYGATRATADGMAQLRNALFARVAEGALRRMARRTFTHLHALELSFHLERQTGALTRVVERGTRAVGTLLSMSVLQVLPLAFEVTVVSALLARNCGPAFAAVTLSTLGPYGAFTFIVTRARTKVRRAQNKADSEASQRFTDSMLNFETVKYFDATAHEERRYDQALEKYMGAAIKTQLTLAGLNFGQACIFSTGLGLSMCLAANEVAAGRMSVGDVVMVHGLVFQLTMPLNILGQVYNSVRQAATDMAALVQLQQRTPMIASKEDAPPLMLSAGGRVEFEGVEFSYPSSGLRATADKDAKATCEAPLAEECGHNPPHLLRGVSFVVEPGQTVAIVGGSGSGKSSILRLLYRFYDPQAGRITIDGQDLREVELDSVRKVLGVVPQVWFSPITPHNHICPLLTSPSLPLFCRTSCSSTRRSSTTSSTAASTRRARRSSRRQSTRRSTRASCVWQMATTRSSASVG